MKHISLLIAAFALITSYNVQAEGSSYVTGNLQFHSGYLQGARQTSTLEAGHTFEGGLTLLTEFDMIPVGKVDPSLPNNSPYITLGIEQSFQITKRFRAGIGYHHLIHNGEFLQYRPLFKLGYHFDNGIDISNRTRFHLENTKASVYHHDHKSDEARLDTAISYTFKKTPLQVRYNNVLYTKDLNYDHEFRATWVKDSSVQPYIEYRSQYNNNATSTPINHVFVVGATVLF